MAHQHKPKHADDFPYLAPIDPCRVRNLAAHGGITRVETCGCGAVRKLNINGQHIEAGEWLLGKKETPR